MDQSTGFLESELDRAVATFGPAAFSGNVVPIDAQRSQASLRERRTPVPATARCAARGGYLSSTVGVIAALGILLLIIFIIWVAVANAIYIANFGYASPSSVETFLHDVFTTRFGWNLILVGNGIGLLFAILVLTISVVFPLLLDRDVGAAVAFLTSIRAVAHN